MHNQNICIAAAQLTAFRGDYARNIEQHLLFIHTAAERAVNLLVFPELSLTGYEPELAQDLAITPEDSVLVPLSDAAKQFGMTIVTGAPLKGDKGQIHIGALAFLPDGSIFTYCKQYIHHSECNVFSPRLTDNVLSVEGNFVALAICFDTSHADHAQSAANRGASVYAAGVMVSAKGYEKDAAFMKRYAKQHSMVTLLANHSGPGGAWIGAGKSAIWNEQGEVVAAATGCENALVIGRREGTGWRGERVTIAGAFQLT